MSKKNMYAPPAGAFHFPYIAGQQFAPGIQIYSPGESAALGAQPGYGPLPWPDAVPSLVALANFEGEARTRGGQPFVNRVAQSPSDFLYLAGYAGKSLG